MADRFDFVGLFGDERFKGLDDESRSKTIQDAWKSATEKDERLGQLNDQQREQFLSRAWEKANPKPAATPASEWEGFVTAMDAAGTLPGVSGTAAKLLGSDGFFGAGARGTQRTMATQAAAIPTTAGLVATEAVSAPFEMSEAGFDALKDVELLNRVATEPAERGGFGLKDPKPEDLVEIVSLLQVPLATLEGQDRIRAIHARDILNWDGQERDPAKLFASIQVTAEHISRKKKIYDKVSPIANWVRSMEAPASPGEARGDLGQTIGAGLGSAAGVMVPSLVLGAMGVPPAAAIAGPGFGIGVEEASRPIEEEYGEYRPEAVLPSAGLQAGLEAIAGPEAKIIRNMRSSVIKRLTEKPLKTALNAAWQEGGTEGLQKAFAIEAKKWSEGEIEFLANLNQDEWKEIGMEAGMGAIVGGLIGGGAATLTSAAQTAGEEAQKHEMKRFFEQNAGQQQESMPGRLPPQFDEAQQVLTENAPAFLHVEGREELLKKFTEGTLSEEDIAGIIAEDDMTVNEAVDALDESERMSFETLGINAREEIGKARAIEGQDDTNNPLGRLKADLKVAMLAEADAEAAKGNDAKAERIRAEAESFTLTAPANAEELGLHGAASTRGVEVVFSDSKALPAGASKDPGVVVIDRNVSKKQQVKQVLMHEMGHQLRLQSPDVWTNLQQLLQKEFASEWAAARARVQSDPQYRAQRKGLKRAEKSDLLMEEITSQVLERNGEMIWRALGNQAKLEELYKKRGRYQKLLDWFVDAATNLAKGIGMDMVTRDQMKADWKLPLAVAQSLNINTGAPRSVIAPGIEPVVAAEATQETAEATPSTPKVGAAPSTQAVESPETAPESPQTAPEPAQEAEVVPFPKPKEQPAEAEKPAEETPQDNQAPPREERKVASTRRKKSRKKRKKARAKKRNAEERKTKTATRNVDKVGDNNRTQAKIDTQLKGAEAQRKATDEQAKADDHDPQTQEQLGPNVNYATRLHGFYSPSSLGIRSIMDSGQKAMRPRELMARLNSEKFKREFGVNAVELKLLGIEDYLEVLDKDGKGRVSMQDVSDYIDSNGVLLEEVILDESQTPEDEARIKKQRDDYIREQLDGRGGTEFDKLQDLLHANDVYFEGIGIRLVGPMYEGGDNWGSGGTSELMNVEEDQDLFEEESAKGEGSWKVTDVIDGEVFKEFPISEWRAAVDHANELALDAAKKAGDAPDGVMDINWDVFPQQIEDAEPFDNEMTDILMDEAKELYPSDRALFGPKFTQHPIYTSKGGIPDTYREFVIMRPGSEFDGSHHNETYGGPLRKGVVMHIRTQEFLDANGERVLLIDEIQSDYYSAHRKLLDTDKMRALETEMEEKYPGIDLDNRSEYEQTMSEEDFKRFMDARRKGIAGKEVFQAEDLQPAVTGAMDKWVKLAAKRVIKYAAEKGIKTIAWTTPEMQTQRVQSSANEVVDTVTWQRTPNGITVRTFKDNDMSEEYRFDKRGYVPPGRENGRYTHVTQVFTGQLGLDIMDKTRGKVGEPGGKAIQIGGEMFKSIYGKHLPKAFTGKGGISRELKLKIFDTEAQVTFKSTNPSLDEVLTQYQDYEDYMKHAEKISAIEADAMFEEGFVVIAKDDELFIYDEEASEMDTLDFMSNEVNELNPTDLHGEGGAMSFYALRKKGYPPSPTLSVSTRHLQKAGAKAQPATLPAVRLSDEVVTAVQNRPLRMHYATHPIQPQKGGAIDAGAQAVALSPGDQWGRQISRGINAALATVGTEKKWQDFHTRIFDHFRRVRDLQDELFKKYGIVTPETLNTYLMEEMMYGKTDYEVKQATAKVIHPLLKYMNEKGITEQDATLFLHAMHAFERNRRGYELNVIKARERLRADLKKGGMTKLKAAAELKKIDKMVSMGKVPGSGHLRGNEAASFQQLKDLVDSGELTLDLDAFAQHYGYESLDAALASTRRQQYKAMNKWKKEHFSGGLGGKYGNMMGLWQRLTQEKLRLQKKYNLIGDESYQNMMMMYQFYSPLKGRREYDQGDVEDILKTHGAPDKIGEFLDIRRPEEKRTLGRLSTPVNSIVGQAMQDLQRSIVRGEKNRVGNTFLEFAQRYLPESVVEINKVVEKKVFDKSSGSVKEVNDFWYNERPNVFATKKGDDIYYMTIKDARLAIALKGLGEHNASTVSQIHGKLVRKLAQLATSLNPEFWISNAARDVQTAMINSLGKEVGLNEAEIAKMMVKIPAAGGAIMRTELPDAVDKPIEKLTGKESKDQEWAYWWRRMQKAGGRIGYYGLTTVEDTFKRAQQELHSVGKDTVAVHVVNTWHGFGETVEAVNTAFENGTRLVAFKAMIEKGATDKQAAHVARNLTVNFNRHGSWRGLSAWYMFANASLQGVARMFTAYSNPKVRNYMNGLAVMSFMLSRWNREVMGEDDDGKDKWDNMSRYHKNKRLMVAIPTAGDPIIVALPAPHGYSFFHSIGVGLEGVVDSIVSKNKSVGDAAAHAATDAVGALSDSFNPLGGRFDSWKGVGSTFMPTIPRIFWDLGVNEDFAGRKITPEFHQDGTPWYQTTRRNTSDWAIFGSKLMSGMTGGDTIKGGAVNISPDAVDFLLRTVLSGTGRFYADGIQAITDGVDTPTHKTPFVRKFRYEYQPAESIDEYYTLRGQLWKVRRDFDAAKKRGDSDLMADLNADYRHMRNESLYKRLQSAEKERKAAKERGDREGENKAMLRWLKFYRQVERSTY